MLEIRHIRPTGPAVKTITGRELEHRARHPDPARRALLANDLRSGALQVRTFTDDQIKRLVPFRPPRRTELSARERAEELFAKA
jgi:hypothetical protein